MYALNVDSRWPVGIVIVKYLLIHLFLDFITIIAFQQNLIFSSFGLGNPETDLSDNENDIHFYCHYSHFSWSLFIKTQVVSLEESLKIIYYITHMYYSIMTIVR